MRTIQIIISGKVQGVFYRYSCWEIASELGLKGTVQNLANGTVLVIAHGTEESLMKLVKWCKKGPPRARVDDVIVETISFQDFFSFTIIK